MAKMEGVLYFKIIYSGKPSEFDAVGCDGLYIKSCEQVTDEVAQLEASLADKDKYIRRLQMRAENAERMVGRTKERERLFAARATEIEAYKWFICKIPLRQFDEIMNDVPEEYRRIFILTKEEYETLKAGGDA